LPLSVFGPVLFVARWGRTDCALHLLAIIEQHQGNIADARRLYEESIEIDKGIGNLYGIATSLAMQAQLNVLEGRFEEAVAQSREAVRLLEEIGSFKAAVARENLREIESLAAKGKCGGV
jgi:tetratricopeptide (TPR) repeat protein